MKLLIPPPVQAIICAAGMWVVSQRFPSLDFTFAFQQYLAIAICALGILIDLVSVGLFAKLKTTVSPFSPHKTEKLVTTGFYQYTRNPMYLGMVVILTGLGIWLGNFGSFILIPGFMWFVTHFQIIPEEEILREKLGDEYENYTKRVRRWI